MFIDVLMIAVLLTVGVAFLLAGELLYNMYKGD